MFFFFGLLLSDFAILFALLRLEQHTHTYAHAQTRVCVCVCVVDYACGLPAPLCV